jgi:N4-gp56 family major capsid protein
MGLTTYNDINPRTEAFASVDFLTAGLPYLCLELVADALLIPKNKSKAISLRKFNSLPLADTPMAEGVTPPATEYTVTDVTFTLDQYGAWVPITDVIMDTHEDPVLQQLSMRLGEQCAETIEKLRYGAAKAGTNVIYANGTSRTTLAGTINRAMQRRIVAALKTARAKKITSTVRATPNYGTQAINAGFIAIAHPNMESDIRDLTGFKSVEDYGQMTPFSSEIGACEEVRYLLTDTFSPWEDAGAAYTGAYKSTGGANNDVYPIIYFAREAFATVALKTYSFKNSNGKTEYVKPIDLIIRNPKPQDGDELAQRGSAGWKTYHVSGIQNDLWMCRFEGCATA